MLGRVASITQIAGADGHGSRSSLSFRVREHHREPAIPVKHCDWPEPAFVVMSVEWAPLPAAMHGFDPILIATSRQQAEIDKIDGEALDRTLPTFKRGEPPARPIVNALYGGGRSPSTEPKAQGAGH